MVGSKENIDPYFDSRRATITYSLDDIRRADLEKLYEMRQKAVGTQKEMLDDEIARKLAFDGPSGRALKLSKIAIGVSVVSLLVSAGLALFA